MVKSRILMVLFFFAVLTMVISRPAYCEGPPTDVVRAAVSGSGDNGGDSVGGSAATALPDLFTGSVSYNIPIEVPPGRNGLVPNLALLYRSNNGNGWLGMGWELEVGSIERKMLGGINFSKDDYVFRRAGAASELVSISSSEFRSKIEKDFIRIEKISDRTAFHSYYFVATNKLGIKFYFGQTEDSSVYGTQGVFKWALNKIEDTNGNTVVFTYVRDNAQIYLDRIDYNGNRIKFTLEDRPDNSDSFMTNFPIKMAKRLQSIDVLGSDGSRLRTYYLQYDLSPATGRSMLKLVRQFGKNGMTDNLSLKVAFTYTQSNSKFYDPAPWLGDTANNTQTYNISGYQYVGDFNGDGKVDYMYLASDGWYVAKSNGNGFDLPTRWLDVNGPTSKTYNAHNQFVGDCNGDGKIDYMYLAPDGWYVALSTGNSFATPTRWLDINGPSSQTVSSLYTYQLAGDFTGDGKMDYMYLAPDGWYVAESTGNGFKPPERWLADVIDNDLTYSGDQAIADFNGDGKVDYLYNRNGWHVALSNGRGFDTPTFWLSASDPVGAETKYVGDLNGDGKIDLMYLPASATGYWYVALSTGSSFTIPKPWLSVNGPTGPTYNSPWLMYLGDFNGDGKVDYMYNRGGWYVALSNGNSFATPTLWLNDSISGSATSNPGYQFLGDFTGDGKIDYLYRNSLGWQVAKNDRVADLLAHIGNSYAGTTDISYTSSTEFANELLPFAIPVISSMTVKDGADTEGFDDGSHATVTQFTFSGGYYYVKDRDFRGFNHSTVIGHSGANGAQITEYWFHQGNDTDIDANNPNVDTGYMKGKPYRVRVSDSNSNIYTETETTYAADRNLAAPWFTPQSQVDTYICDGKVTGACKGSGYAKHLRTAFQFDGDAGASEYGNLTLETRYGDVDDPNDDFTVYKTYSPNLDKWIVGLPSSETVYEGNSTATPITSTSYYYDGTSSCSTASQNQTPDKGQVTRVLRWLKYDTLPEKFVEERMAYDAAGNLVCRRDGREYTTTITYDGSNTFPVVVTTPPVTGHPLGFTTTTQYYGVNGVPADKGLYGQVKSETDPNSQSTTTEYDTLGRKSKVVNADGTWTEWQYLDFGLVGNQRIKTISSDGIWSENYFDGLMRTIKDVRKGPSDTKAYSQSDTAYDAQGNMHSRTIPAFPQDYANAAAHPIVYAYDTQGRVTQVTSPDTTVTRTCYDRDVTVSIDTNGHRRREVRDANGRLVKVQEYEGKYDSCSTDEGTPYATTQYVYDVLGNLRFVTDTQGNQTEIRYDTLGRKRYMSDPDMGVWTYDYDDNGNLISQTDANQNTIRFDYDALNRLTAKHYPTGTDVVMVYDEPTSSNANGRLTKMTDSSGQTTYSYDTVGRVRSTVKTITGVSYPLNFGYLNGRLDNIKYPDNETVYYSYDPAGNLGKVGSYVTYEEYDSLGRPESATYGNNARVTYAYNPLTKRLSNWSVTSPTQGVLVDNGYGYDNKGNITSITDRLSKPLPAITNETYTFTPARAHAISATSSGRVFQYDNNGNIVNDGIRAIAYDYDNMPTSIGITRFTYDGNGARVKKNFGGVNTIYIDKLYECANGVCVKYIFAGDTRIALKSSIRTLYYHPDHQGSTSVVTNDQGDKVEELAYYPFGETGQETGSVKVNHMYTGQEWEWETGLYNYNARIYDPALGRFLTPDTVVQDFTDPQILNRYSYAKNNPMLYVDSTGHWIGFAALIADVLIGAAEGAAIGTLMAAVTGGDIGTAALTGAITGGFFGAAGYGIEAMGVKNAFAQAGMHGLAGATSGAINSAITGNDIGMGAAIGAGSAMFAEYVGSYPESNIAVDVVRKSIVGGMIGGSIAAIYGEDFGKGFGTGAMTSSIASLANGASHKYGLRDALRDVIFKGAGGSKLAIERAYGAVTDIATEGPPAAKATMALAATPMVAAGAYVAGPYALSYALMNPQGVVDFAEALAPGPPGPNNWGRIFGGIDFLQWASGK